MDESRMDSAGKAKDAIGFLLLFFGAGIALWAFFTSSGIFNDPSKLAPFQDLVSRRFESTFATDAEQVKRVIPPEILAYIVPLALLSIIVGIAGVLITAGVKLLDSDFQLLIRRFATFKHQIYTRLESFKDALNERKK